jgi:UPF0716 protein FxsA
MPLFLILLIVPIVEIALFIEVGGRIGTWPTIAVVVLTAIVGTIMLRRQGLAALRSVQSRLAAGENPGRLLADGAMILLAGALLVTPGFFTDAVGFALLVPAIRQWLWNWLAPRLTVVQAEARRAEARHSATRNSGARGAAGHQVPPRGQTVEGDYEVIEPGFHDSGEDRDNRQR